MSATRSALDESAAVADTDLSAEDLAVDITELALVRQKVDVLIARKIKSLADRGGHTELGYRSPAMFLADQARMSAGHAKRVVSHANAAEKVSSSKTVHIMVLGGPPCPAGHRRRHPRDPQWRHHLGGHPPPTRPRLFAQRIVLGPDSEVLDVGRKTRVWIAAQRRAIIARDRHCQGQGCERDPRWCDIHIDHWTDGGETTVEKGRLLCRPCHTIEHLKEACRRRRSYT